MVPFFIVENVLKLRAPDGIFTKIIFIYHCNLLDFKTGARGQRTFLVEKGNWITFQTNVKKETHSHNFIFISDIISSSSRLITQSGQKLLKSIIFKLIQFGIYEYRVLILPPSSLKSVWLHLWYIFLFLWKKLSKITDEIPASLEP